jgi:F0F1-type ATP synthase membrane subunit b/b'
MEDMGFDVWVYLAQLGAVVLVLAIGISVLWNQYIKSEDKREKNLADTLSTLNELSKVLAHLEYLFKDTNHHVSSELKLSVTDLKKHIDDKVDKLR